MAEKRRRGWVIGGKEQRQKMSKEEIVAVGLLHRPVPEKHTDEGLRGPG